VTVIFVAGVPYLELRGDRVALNASDWIRLGRLTPLGRKVHFLRKGKTLRSRRADDPDAALLLAWTRLPASEWAFSLPAEPVSFCLPG
jgi:hypothetical protein